MGTIIIDIEKHLTQLKLTSPVTMVDISPDLQLVYFNGIEDVSMYDTLYVQLLNEEHSKKVFLTTDKDYYHKIKKLPQQLNTQILLLDNDIFLNMDNFSDIIWSLLGYYIAIEPLMFASLKDEVAYIEALNRLCNRCRVKMVFGIKRDSIKLPQYNVKLETEKNMTSNPFNQYTKEQIQIIEDALLVEKVRLANTIFKPHELTKEEMQKLESNDFEYKSYEDDCCDSDSGDGDIQYVEHISLSIDAEQLEQVSSCIGDLWLMPYDVDVMPEVKLTRINHTQFMLDMKFVSKEFVIDILDCLS